MTPFWAVKYPGGNAGFSMKDVIKVSHPIPGNQALNDLYKYIVSGERCKNNAYLEAVRALPECSSEKAAELIRQFKLPQEAVIGRMQKMDYIVWHALADTMPLFALLRSLSAISRGMGVPDTVRLMRPRFEDSEALSKSQILPFRFMIAADEFESSAGTKPLVDLVRGAMEMSVANMPEIKEQTIFAMDTSASMQETEGKRKAFHTAIYMGMAMKKRNPDTVKLITFDSDARPFEFSSYDSVYTQAKRLYPDGGSTETEKVMRFVTRDIKNLMIATDGEENNGSNIARELASRRFTGQKLRTFIIDISAYTGAGKLINDNSEDSFYIYGCSDQILKYVALAANGFGTLVDSIDAEVARRGRN
jgi:60 kDa SS-A/Ro ribonucleoprotein